MSSQQYLEELPKELQYHVCSEMTVEDLFALALTCKALYDVVQDRIIWEAAVLSMCRQHGLFEPSYPIKSMGVVDLQKAAFGPILFNRRMKRLQQEGDDLDSESQEIPTLRPKETKFPNKLTSTISELVPGGRYLFTGGSFTGSIVLWDLGTAGPFFRAKPKQDLLAISQCTLEQSRFFMKALTPITPRPGERTLRFTATVQSQEPPRTQFVRLYEVGPLPEQTCIRQVDEIQLDPAFSIVQPGGGKLSQSRLVFTGSPLRQSSHKCIVIWDYVKGHVQAFKLTPAWLGFKSVSLTLAYTDEVIVGLTAKGVVAWKIPTDAENPPTSTRYLTGLELQNTIMTSPEIEPICTDIHGLPFDLRQVFGYNNSVSAAGIMIQGDFDSSQSSSSFTYDCPELSRSQNRRAFPLQRFTLDIPTPSKQASSSSSDKPEPQPPQPRVTPVSKSRPIPVTPGSALKASVLSWDHMLTMIESPGQQDVRWAHSPLTPPATQDADSVDYGWRIVEFEVEREWQAQGTPCVCSGRMVYADTWKDVYVVDLLLDRQAGREVPS